MRSKAEKMSMDAAKKLVGVEKPAAVKNPNATPITEVHAQVGVKPHTPEEVKAIREAETKKPETPPAANSKVPATPPPPPAKKVAAPRPPPKK